MQTINRRIEFFKCIYVSWAMKTQDLMIQRNVLPEIPRKNKDFTRLRELLKRARKKQNEMIDILLTEIDAC